MRKKVPVIVTAVFIAVIMSSCFDLHEITDVAYIQFIGIDKGTADRWRLTVSIAAQESGKSDSSGGMAAPARSKSVTIEAPSFFSAIGLLDTNISRKIDFSHANLLVFSENIAKSGMVGEYIAPLVRYHQIRRTLLVAVVRGSAQEFIENIQPYLGGSVSSEITDLAHGVKGSSYFPSTTLNDFYNAMKSTYIQPAVMLGGLYNQDNIPNPGDGGKDATVTAGSYFAGDIPRKGGNSIEFLGCALFDGDKMVGKLNGHETRMMLLATGDYDRGILLVQDPEAPELVVPFRLKLAQKPSIDVVFDKGIPVIKLKLSTEGDIYAIQSQINYEDPQRAPILENAVKTHLKESLDKTIEKCRLLGCDVFNFGYAAAKQFPTIEEWESYNWNKRFKEAKIETYVDFKIKKTGGMLRSSQIRE
ncbi:MAG: Ger(x)C family spore germination protein [Bacillota bacterium]